MEFLPRAIGTRPRLACEVRAEGVVAARSDNESSLLSAVARVALGDGAAVGRSARDGRAADERTANSGTAGRRSLAGALKQALDAVSGRGRETTLVVPDAAVRVLLVDFDELPAKTAEALPVVRFRLKKLLPFDADDAGVSFQVMASRRGQVQVLAAAMERSVLEEYEAAVRDAGYEPGAVLPSTLAALAGLSEMERPQLVVNAGRDAVTTAIVRGGVLLLHRMVDLAGGEAATAVTETRPAGETAPEDSRETSISAIAARFAALEGQQATGSRVASALASEAAKAGVGNDAAGAGQGSAGADAPSGVGAGAWGADAPSGVGAGAWGADAAAAGVSVGAVDVASARSAAFAAYEVAQAVSVAAAYFEDTLETAPEVVLSAGTMSAEGLRALLNDGQGGVGPVRVEEMVERAMLGAGAENGVPLGWLAGVRGALRS